MTKKLLCLILVGVFAIYGTKMTSSAATVNGSVAGNDYTLGFSYFRYDAKFEEFKNRMESAVELVRPSFSVADLNITREVATQMYLEFCYIFPNQFHVWDRGYTFNTQNNVVTTVNINYYGFGNTASKLTSAKGKFNMKAIKLLNTIPTNASDLEKVILAHDYIANHTMYAYESPGVYESKHSAYQCMVENRSTCTGFSRAFLHIMTLLEIDARIVRGNDNVDHTWNMVKINDDWYHIDVTHALNRSSAVMNQRLGHVGHQYEDFLHNDVRRRAFDPNWVTLTPPAVSNMYENSFWEDVVSAFFRYGDSLIYFSKPAPSANDGNRLVRQNLTAWNPSTNQTTQVLTFDAKWRTPTGYYSNKTPFLGMYQNKLYYNTPTAIWRYDLQTSQTQLYKDEANSLTGVQQIFEMAVRDNTLIYRIKEDANVSSRVVREEAIDLDTGLPYRKSEVSLCRTTNPSILLNDGATHNFATRGVGYAASTTGITINNVGNVPTGDLSIQISGEDANAFTLNKTGVNSIASGASDNFSVGFKAGLIAGTYNAQVSVKEEGEVIQFFYVKFTVTGTTPTPNNGISLCRTTNPSILLNNGATHNFATRAVGYAASTTGITINNVGNTPTGNLSIEIVGTDAAAFTLNKTTVNSIAVGASNNFSVGFKAGLLAGTYKAQVHVRNAGGMTQFFNVKFTVTN